MNYLSARANAILDLILKQGNGKTAFKIDNTDGIFMPLSVEILPDYTFPELGICRIISLCHYGEQNGDLMRDPEMCILQTQTKFRIAYYFRNDYIASERDARHPVTDLLDRRKIQDLNLFASGWLETIKEQQCLSPLNILAR